MRAHGTGAVLDTVCYDCPNESFFAFCGVESTLNPESEPTVYVIAGPNGAGKTTFAQQYLQRYARCNEFLNADIIAAKLSPTSPAASAFDAARIMLEQMRELTSKRKTFSFETTLAGRAHCQNLKNMRSSFGYCIELVFLWLPSEEMAIRRVATRVSQGGHDIPIPTIRKRYRQGLANFGSRYRQVADRWSVYDAACRPAVEVVKMELDELIILDDDRYKILNESSPEIFS